MKLKKLLYFGIMIFLLFFVASEVSAFGLMSKPIEINNAMRNETIQEVLQILNSKEIDVEYNLVTEGEISEWINFYSPDDIDQPITQAIGRAKSYLNTIIQITVPDDVANGYYVGKITVSTLPVESEEEGAQATVFQKLSREIFITVTDEEEINLAASVIASGFSIKKGDVLKIRIIYDNQGNIRMSPQAQVKIVENISNKTVYNAIFLYPEDILAVKPSVQYEIPPLKIPTTGIDSGRYRAEMSFLYNNEIVLERDFKFSINDNVSVLGWVGSFKSVDKIKYGLLFLSLVSLALSVVFFKKSKYRHNSSWATKKIKNN